MEALNSVKGALIFFFKGRKKKKEQNTQVQRRPCGARGRGWRSVAPHQVTRGTTWSWKRWGMESPLESSQEVWPCQHPNFEFLTSRTVRKSFVVLNHLVCGIYWGSHRKLIYHGPKNKCKGKLESVLTEMPV